MILFFITPFSAAIAHLQVKHATEKKDKHHAYLIHHSSASKLSKLEESHLLLTLENPPRKQNQQIAKKCHIIDATFDGSLANYAPAFLDSIKSVLAVCWDRCHRANDKATPVNTGS